MVADVMLACPCSVGRAQSTKILEDTRDQLSPAGVVRGRRGRELLQQIILDSTGGPSVVPYLSLDPHRKP